METVFNFLRAIVGMAAVLVIWFAIQTFVRRRSGCGPNQDVLDFMKHGCAGCQGKGACHNRSEGRKTP
jgi:hypothetical protein